MSESSNAFRAEKTRTLRELECLKRALAHVERAKEAIAESRSVRCDEGWRILAGAHYEIDRALRAVQIEKNAWGRR